MYSQTLSEKIRLNTKLTLALSISMIKSRYRKTFAGFIWVVANPILLFSIQSIVFKKFLQIDVPDYYLFLLGGLLPWIFITTTLDMCTPMLVTQAELLRNFRISPMHLISAQCLDNFINFLFSFTLLLIPVSIFFNKLSYGIFFLPLSIFQLLVGVVSLAIIFSTLQVFYRDIRFLLPFVTNILFFMTPIFYPPWVVPDNFKWLVTYNPFYRMIDPFRLNIYNFQPDLYWPVLAKGFAVSIAFAIIAFFIWRKKSHGFYLRL